MIKKLYVNVNGHLLLVDDKNLAEAGDGLFFHVSPEHAGLEFVDYFMDRPNAEPSWMHEFFKEALRDRMEYYNSIGFFDGFSVKKENL